MRGSDASYEICTLMQVQAFWACQAGFPACANDPLLDGWQNAASR